MTSDRDADRYARVFYAIYGNGRIGDLVEALRRGDLDPSLQRMLADAIDPDGETPTRFVQQGRGRGKSLKNSQRQLGNWSARRDAAGRVSELQQAEPGVKLGAHVDQVSQETGLSRTTIYEQLKKDRAWAKLFDPRNLMQAVSEAHADIQHYLQHGVTGFLRLVRAGDRVTRCREADPERSQQDIVAEVAAEFDLKPEQLVNWLENLRYQEAELAVRVRQQCDENLSRESIIAEVAAEFDLKPEQLVNWLENCRYQEAASAVRLRQQSYANPSRESIITDVASEFGMKSEDLAAWLKDDDKGRAAALKDIRKQRAKFNAR